MKPRCLIFASLITFYSCGGNEQKNMKFADSVTLIDDTLMITSQSNNQIPLDRMNNSRDKSGLTTKVSELKNDEDFNNYFDIEVENGSNKKIVALQFFTSHEFYSGSINEKIRINGSSTKTFKLYLPANVPNPELIKVSFSKAIYEDGEIYKSLPKLRSYN